MDKKFDVVAIGELLIDFTNNGKSEQGNDMFEACPGGAPCNVLAMLSKQGRKTAFIGKVGFDSFGRKLKDVLENENINTEGLLLDETVNTTLAFVHNLPGGDRDFTFYRKNSADTLLRVDEVKEELIRSSKIFHFGTLSLTEEPVRSATKHAIQVAEESDCLISFDPNLRKPLWDSLDEAKKAMEYGFTKCDILKIADNELQFVTGVEDYEEGIKILQDLYQIPIIFLTLGKRGSRVYYKDFKEECEGFKVNAIDATGAGDTFCGSVLSSILEHGLSNLTPEKLQKMLKLANAAAAIVTTRKGAIRSMPNVDEVLEMVMGN